MNIKLMQSALFAITLLGYNGQALAIPSLQLDVLGGTYDRTSETIVSNGDIFTLYAYLNADAVNQVGDTYFISAALTPKVSGPSAGSPKPDFGSFLFAGQTVNVTADMEYGTPPVSTLYPDLPGHEIFSTYYKEISFNFSPSNKTAFVNSQDNPGSGPQTGTDMFYSAFAIDTSLLDDGYEIHFDLYNENIITRKRCAPRYDTQFAPFSHDAEGHGNPPTPVPEPATMLLLGSGLAGLIGVRRKRKA